MHLLPGNAQWIGQRDEQQDAFAFAHVAEDTFRGHGGVLAVVADGMGGLANGAEASRLAVKTFIAAYDEKTADEPIPDALLRAIEAANQAVWRLACDSDGEGNVGPTLVAAVIRGPQLFWVGAGDSRLYLYRAAGRTLTCCTPDHNLFSDLMPAVRDGQMSRQEALDHPDAGALTSFLGMKQVPKVDRNLRPLLESGDRILLCSDGLYGTVADNELAAALGGEPHAAAETLLDQVKTRDEPRQDNTTIVILGCEEQETLPTTRRIEQTRQRRPLLPVIAASGIVVLLGVALWFSGLLPQRSPPPSEPAASALSTVAVGEQAPAANEADATEAPPPQPATEQADRSTLPGGAKPTETLAPAADEEEPTERPDDDQQAQTEGPKRTRLDQPPSAEDDSVSDATPGTKEPEQPAVRNGLASEGNPEPNGSEPKD